MLPVFEHKPAYEKATADAFDEFGDSYPHNNEFTCPDLQALGIQPRYSKPSVSYLCGLGTKDYDRYLRLDSEKVNVDTSNLNIARFEMYLASHIMHFVRTCNTRVITSDLLLMFSSQNIMERRLMLQTLQKWVDAGLLDVGICPLKGYAHDKAWKPLEGFEKLIPKNWRPNVYTKDDPLPHPWTPDRYTESFLSTPYEVELYDWIDRLLIHNGVQLTPGELNVFYYLLRVATFVAAGILEPEEYCKTIRELSLHLHYPLSSVGTFCAALCTKGLVDRASVSHGYCYGVNTCLFGQCEPPSIITDMIFSSKEAMSDYRESYYRGEIPDASWLRLRADEVSLARAREYIEGYRWSYVPYLKVKR